MKRNIYSEDEEAEKEFADYRTAVTKTPHPNIIS